MELQESIDEARDAIRAQVGEIILATPNENHDQLSERVEKVLDVFDDFVAKQNA